MDFYLGGIILFAGNFAPINWMLCEGQLLPISQYTALFSVVGTTYGGDGMKTFALPKLTAPVTGLNYIIAINGIYPPRD